jgi:riboflavin synthase
VFTGLVKEIGQVIATTTEGDLLRVELKHGMADLELGESIAVNGVCLTIGSMTQEKCVFDLGPETLKVTNLGRLRPGQRVHLERALRPIDRLGGHFVLGHVDDMATLLSVTDIDGGGAWLELKLKSDVGHARYTIPKGSICLEGVSLTIAEKLKDSIRIMLIPHTWANTHFSQIQPGEELNVEYDVLAKFVWEQRKELLIPE